MVFIKIIDDFSEEQEDNKECLTHEIDDELLDEYIQENTYDGQIRLLRRYYGIVAKKA